MLQGSDDTVILPVDFSPLMTSSQFEQLIRGPISVEQDKNCMDDLLEPTPSVATRPGDGLEPTPSVATRQEDVLQPTPSVATRQEDVLQPTPSVATRQEDLPGPSRKDIVHDAVAAAGLQFEWYSTQEDEICSKAQSSDPPTNAPLETDQSPPSSPIPPTQNYMLGDMESAIKHLRTVSELRQWGDEWNVADPRLLRALEALGDSEAFLALQLQKMVDFQSISDFAGINRVYDNELVRGKLLSIAQDYDIDCPNDVSDIKQLALHIQNGMLPGLRFHARPDENRTITSVDSVVQGALQTGSFRPEMVARGGEQHIDSVGFAQTASSQEPGQVIYTRTRVEESTVEATANTLQTSSFRPEMVARGGEKHIDSVGFAQTASSQEPGQVIYTRSRVEESIVEATANTSQTGSFRPEMLAEVQQSVFPLPHDQVTDTDRGSQTDSIRPEMVGMGDHQTDPYGVSQPAPPQADDQVMEVSDNIEVEPFEPLNESGSQRPDVTARPFFQCDLCAKSFGNRLGLERHIKNKHPKAPVCFGCLKSFSSVSNMKRHSKICKGKPTSDQGRQGYQCLKCGKIFPSTSGLRKHVASSCSDAARPRQVRCRECNPPEFFSDRVELGQHKKAVHSKK